MTWSRAAGIWGLVWLSAAYAMPLWPCQGGSYDQAMDMGTFGNPGQLAAAGGRDQCLVCDATLVVSN